MGSAALAQPPLVPVVSELGVLSILLGELQTQAWCWAGLGVGTPVDS